MSFPGDTLPSPRPLPPISLHPGASLIIFNHLNTVQQDIITDIKAMTAQVHSRLFDLEEREKRAGKRSIGVQTDEIPPKCFLRGASPVITEPVDLTGLCSGYESEFKSQPESGVGDFMGSSDVPSCSLGLIPPAPQPEPTLFIANSYGRPPSEVDIGRLEASNGFNAIVKEEDETADEAKNTQSERGASLYGPDRRAIQISSPLSDSSEFLWVGSPPHNESMTYRVMMEEAYPYEYDDGTLASFM
ncbi:uncharacterized protein B0J16DRAFT_388575 [Fusarium flagelliforme]|uniref:Uncharacterized protein n=1 Tax=Fusarium flagelliforme TaxID=2675880 RepID=A0A395M822_9HYPO|nr:uncharacterized protein B0J16DRAFT_388575 [Fusarium flagelliforme]KAH7174747.1 hypothetical protein B0J16DRAFT_388575 [Fusarium flagelliforme]RFN44018.1 hypothetical protein FIE12Z_11723 [Fusarium flagelliforme]